MDILVNGEIKELTAVGSNGIEWTKDLLGGYSTTSYDYDEERDIYTMSAEDYEWWLPIVDRLNLIEEMKGELSYDELEEYNTVDFWNSYSDLEYEVNAKLDWLNKKLSLSSNDTATRLDG